MAQPEPLLPQPSLKQRFVRLMRLAAVFSIVIAAIAVVLVARGSEEPRIHMLIATALGVGLSVLLGTALMTLVFLSNRHGHDSDAHHVSDRKDK